MRSRSALGSNAIVSVDAETGIGLLLPCTKRIRVAQVGRDCSSIGMSRKTSAWMGPCVEPADRRANGDV